MTISPTLRILVATARLAGVALAATAAGAAQAITLDAPSFAGMGMAADSPSSLLLATALMCLAWTFSKHGD